ncbi:hypothetical protein [Spirosoma utsteinense]|uniref:Uncharacterized protein n=1 Tax=Spirosoma utsteinense TaxID=2585773 RepID=A0ABR6WEY5_9BACT|nr:hypothetical protein [Spirosoma utsteinense]MBC3789126.1 hypothetical protein [Spirosoma utsteinense]MBC3794502.1 hypothetical protein [Spirosoma utsteinense]
MLKSSTCKWHSYGWIGMLCCLWLSALGQPSSTSFGNVYVGKDGAMSFFGTHTFVSPGGIIGTERDPGTGQYGRFLLQPGASVAGVANTAHVDGYVTKVGSASFVFPVGSHGRYRPVAVTPSGSASVTAAYFGVDPNVAIVPRYGTGVNYSTTLPQSTSGVATYYASFTTSAFSTTQVQTVSNKEYWDVDGTDPARITLTWDTNSDVSALTGGDVSRLTIVGWTGSQWVALSSTADATSILGSPSSLSAGSITTNAAIVPNLYNVYALASVSYFVQLSLKAYLQGAGTLATNPAMATADGLMRDQLRSLLPVTEPYTNLGYGSVTSVPAVVPAVFSVTGTSAIVDWVLVEVRDPASTSVVLQRVPALLQRDGDIVASDGVSPVKINVPAGNYFVSVRHRNHLGVMTATALSLSESPAALDFSSSSTANYGTNAANATNAQAIINGRRYLWGGNANGGDGVGGGRNTVLAQGLGNDRSTVSSLVTNASGNTNGLITYVLPGYSASDVNMNGQNVAQGLGADNTFILNIVLSHPGNGTGLVTYSVTQQLP